MNTNVNPQSEAERSAARNEDPISGQPGAHPVGTGLGAAAAGAAAGALGGAIGGPIGAAIGAVAGGIAGGYAGKALAEDVLPTYDAGYWREYYPESSYYDEGIPFDTYEPAYRIGWHSYREDDAGLTWEDREALIREEWEASRGGNERMDWNRARIAAREAHDRAREHAIDRHDRRPGDPISTSETKRPR